MPPPRAVVRMAPRVEGQPSRRPILPHAHFARRARSKGSPHVDPCSRYRRPAARGKGRPAGAAPAALDLPFGPPVFHRRAGEVCGGNGHIPRGESRWGVGPSRAGRRRGGAAPLPGPPAGPRTPLSERSGTATHAAQWPAVWRGRVLKTTSPDGFRSASLQAPPQRRGVHRICPGLGPNLSGACPGTALSANSCRPSRSGASRW
ncbi:hypothetical protein SAMN00790413_00218 [Deinococcus hopiensis KR-140]|uniref:Uncharacterized protein n=1 Tax=Deinococcus hopiensis KR-140 TaxID=695939 RepID=A0A1W1V686_9DEIO|nr:hypothetical protein SAMN00790413_00218 [Deinococcus hopiensis KR-140]